MFVEMMMIMLTVFGLLNWTNGDKLDRLIYGPSCILTECEHPDAAHFTDDGERVWSYCHDCGGDPQLLDPSIYAIPEIVPELDDKLMEEIRKSHRNVTSLCTKSNCGCRNREPEALFMVKD
jgi:hypothetical protein